jgi:hypothetical protein
MKGKTMADQGQEIVFDVPVQCLVKVAFGPAGQGRVTEIRLLPKESDAGYFGAQSAVFDGDERTVEAARAVLDTTTWEPLNKLPPSVVWES